VLRSAGLDGLPAAPLGCWRRDAHSVRVLEHNQEAAAVLQVVQRDHVHVDRADHAVLFDPHALLAHRVPIPLGFVNGGSQGQGQPPARHLQHIKAGFALGRLEIRAGRATKLEDL